MSAQFFKYIIDEKYIALMKSIHNFSHQTTENQQKIKAKIDFMITTKTNSRLLIHLIRNPEAFKTEKPLLYSVFKNWRAENPNIPEQNFETQSVLNSLYQKVIQHPFVCEIDNNSVIIPMVGKDTNILAMFCARFKEYQECINVNPDQCKDIEHKKEYVNWFKDAWSPPKK